VVTLVRWDGGVDGEVGGMWWPDMKGKGGQDRANGRGQTGRGGWARRERGVARPEEGRGCPTRWEGVPDGDLWGLDGMGGCSNRKNAGDGKGGCPNKGEG
jgi:hypothetical protein